MPAVNATSDSAAPGGWTGADRLLFGLLVAVAAHIYTSAIAPQHATLKVEASVIHVTCSSEADAGPRDHALERREGGVAGLAARRQLLLLGLLLLGLGLRGRAGAHSTLLPYWAARALVELVHPADWLPTSKYAS